MTHTEQMREKRAKVIADWKKLMDTAEAEGRAMNADELTAAAKYEADIDAMKRDIDARESHDAIQRAVVPESQQRSGSRETASVTASEAQRAAFWSWAQSGIVQPEQRANMLVGTDASGGYLVPDEFRRELIAALNEENVMRGLATTFTTTTGVMSIPVNSAHGSASWVAEAGAYSASDETFAEVTLSAYKATTLIKVSEEMLNDSAFPVESFLATEFGRRIGKLEEAAFVNGTGSGQPTGVVGGSTVGKTATATNAIVADDLTDLFHALGRAYRQRASWVMADSTVKMIRKLKTGVSGDNTYLWQAGLQAGEPDRLLGRPVYVSEFMPAATTGLKPVIFGDMSAYYIGDRQAISMQRLVELYAANGFVGFRQFRRTDGKLSLATAVYHLIMA